MEIGNNKIDYINGKTLWTPKDGDKDVSSK